MGPPLPLNTTPDKLVNTSPASAMRSPSPSQLPIAAPLLEMGFTFRHIQKAIHATGKRPEILKLLSTSYFITTYASNLYILGNTGELAASSINQLATWMIEHPCIDSDIITVDLTTQDSPTVPEPARPSSHFNLIIDGGLVPRRCFFPRRRQTSDIRSYLDRNGNYH